MGLWISLATAPLMRWRVYRLAGWIGVGLLAVGALYSLVSGRALGAATLIGFLLLAGAFLRWEDRLPGIFDLLVIIATLLNAGGWVFDWFKLPGPYDEITHAFTTFTITAALGYLVAPVFRPEWITGKRGLVFLAIVASFGVAIGGVWEVIEWVVDLFPGTSIFNSLDDTIVDLLMDSLGGVAGALLAILLVRIGNRGGAERQG